MDNIRIVRGEYRTRQTRRGSFVESLANVAIGYGVSLVSQIVIFPLFGVTATIKQNLMVGAAFTVVSIVRSYFVRRLFNKINWGHK